MIELEFLDDVAVIRLNRGVTNALNLEMVRELGDTLATVKSSPSVHALVLSSTQDKFLSIGFDIPQLFSLTKEAFREFYSSFNQVSVALYTMPKPTVAAITGHAIAGGCILALCCDYRVIGEGRKLMGLNEIKLGVPVPYAADCILQSIVGVREARNVVESGDFYEAADLHKRGLVDDVVPQHDVLSQALQTAKLLGSMPPEAYRAIKENRTAQVEARIREKWDEKQRAFLELWYSGDVRDRLREAMEKF